MTDFFDYIDRMPLLDLAVYGALILSVLAIIVVVVSVRRGSVIVDNHWRKIDGAGGTIGVAKPTGYLVRNDQPKTLEGRVLPNRIGVRPSRYPIDFDRDGQ